MGDSSKYLRHARECMDLADKMAGEDRKILLELSEAWLKLAEEALRPAQKP